MIALHALLPRLNGDAFDFVDDHEERISAAREEGRVIAGATHAADVAALVHEHAEAMQHARLQWAEAEGARLTERMLRAIQDTEQRIADGIAAVLEPFVRHAVTDAALAAMRGQIAAAVHDDIQGEFRISGPAALKEKLIAQLQQSGVAATAGADAAIELEAASPEFSAVTCIKRWLAELGDE
jgi:hypothetical protein